MKKWRKKSSDRLIRNGGVVYPYCSYSARPTVN
jgi:hypothetical protein